jgi:hypothetical protein
LHYRNLVFDEPPPETDPISVGGMRTALRWRELWLELRALRGNSYNPVMDVLLALIFWSGKLSLPGHVDS